MKIVLHAFGDKLKGMMEVPEQTDFRFRLAMTQPIQVFSDGINKHPMMDRKMEKICTFEWTGHIYSQAGHEYDGARIYQLVDID